MNQNVLQNQTLTIYVDTYYISMDKDIYSKHRLPDWAQSLAENIWMPWCSPDSLIVGQFQK